MRCSNRTCSAVWQGQPRCPSCDSLPVPAASKAPRSTPRRTDEPSSVREHPPARLPGSRLPGSRRRSRAWVLYAALALMCLVGSVVEPKKAVAGLLFAVLFGAYARYIYRGGSIVFIPVPGCAGVLLLWLAAGSLMAGLILKGVI